MLENSNKMHRHPQLSQKAFTYPSSICISVNENDWSTRFT
jgi:hypothetical protein